MTTSHHHHVAPPKYYTFEKENESCFNGANGRKHIRNFVIVFALVATWFIYAANKSVGDTLNGTAASKDHEAVLSSVAANEEDIAPIQEGAIQVLPEWHNHGRISDEANKLLRQREEKEKAQQAAQQGENDGAESKGG